MSLWFRLGPLGMSSRGRVGVRMGPVSWYGGGRRRRRNASSGSLLVVVLVLGLIVLAIEYWYVTLPIAAVAILLGALVAKHSREKAAARYQAWLEGPPPPLAFPGRFTQNWFLSNGSDLHPRHMPLLAKELRRRGWSDNDIAERAAPYLPWEIN